MQAKDLVNKKPNLIVTHADKPKATVVLDKKDYASKIMKNLDDMDNICSLRYRSYSYSQKYLNNKWKKGKYIDHNFYVKGPLDYPRWE